MLVIYYIMGLGMDTNRKLYILQMSWIIVFREFITVSTVKPNIC